MRVNLEFISIREYTNIMAKKKKHKNKIDKAKEIRQLSAGELGQPKPTQIIPDKTKYTRKKKHKGEDEWRDYK